MFKTGDIVIRKEHEPKHQYLVTLIDNEWNMDIRLIRAFDLIGRPTPSYSIGTVYRVAQKDWDYEEDYKRKLKLIKLRKKCVK